MPDDAPQSPSTAANAAATPSTTLGLGTLVRFLVGKRQAIIDIASSRSALWLGALLVLSAGFAREYDGADLLHAPWHLVLPLAASTATSFILHSLLHVATRRNAEGTPPFWPSYRRFLTLYWMTAPLAWLYAIPVERFMSPVDAVKVNLCLLGIVSLWRVLLITRCAAVLFGSSFLAAFFLVMLFADTLVLVILYFTPLPIFNVMGGIRLADDEYLILNTAIWVGLIGGLSWLIWLLGSLLIAAFGVRTWIPLQFTDPQATNVSKPLWALSALALFAGLAVLPWTQPPQRLRRIVETDLLAGRIDEALRLMSSRSRQDFPPHWDPPPWPGYGQDSPPLKELLEAVTEPSCAQWVCDLYFEKLAPQIADDYSALQYIGGMTDDEFEHYLSILTKLPRSHEFFRKNAEAMEGVRDYPNESNSNLRSRLTRLSRVLDAEEPAAPAAAQ